MNTLIRGTIAQDYRERLESGAYMEGLEASVFGDQLILWENGAFRRDEALRRGGLFDQSAGLCAISSEQFRDALSKARSAGQLYLKYRLVNIPVFPEKSIPPAALLMPPIKFTSMKIIRQLPSQEPDQVVYLFEEEAPDGSSCFAVRSYLRTEGFPLIPFGKKRDANPEEILSVKNS